MKIAQFCFMFNCLFYFFLQKIDFNLTNLANMFDIPGFDSLLRGAIRDSIRGIMVYPEKYVLKLVPDVDISYLKFPLPEVSISKISRLLETKSTKNFST